MKSAPTRLTETTGCANQHPSWLPDGTGLVYESNCQDGSWEIYRAGLSYTLDKLEELELARLISPGMPQTTRLTNNTADDRFPRVSPDGATIALTALRDGDPEIYLLRSDGSGAVRLTNSPGTDQGATWSEDGTRLAFNSTRDGDSEVFVMNRDGSGLRQITRNTAEDSYTVWAQ